MARVNSCPSPKNLREFRQKPKGFLDFAVACAPAPLGMTDAFCAGSLHPVMRLQLQSNGRGKPRPYITQLLSWE
jgi:hypothetical protein